jgi:hypothetical protein
VARETRHGRQGKRLRLDENRGGAPRAWSAFQKRPGPNLPEGALPCAKVTFPPAQPAGADTLGVENQTEESAEFPAIPELTTNMARSKCQILSGASNQTLGTRQAVSQEGS